jgi:hypothetical protein
LNRTALPVHACLCRPACARRAGKHGRQAAPICACLCVARRQVAKATGRRRQVAYKLWELYPNPGAKGRALWPPTTGTPAGTGGGPRARGGGPSLRRAGGDTRGQQHATDGPRGVQGWGLPRARRGTGIWPGRKTATTRRRPAWHTGHCSMSTPVSRRIRAATGFVVSSAERRPRPSREHGAGGAIRGLRHMRIAGTQ